MSDIAGSLSEVRARIADAARRSGRSADDVLLVTVSKTRSLEEIAEAIDAGARDLGENYVQELVEKQAALAAEGRDDVRWHAIGHLQRNKVRHIAAFCRLIHSLDSTRLADEIQKRVGAAGRTQPVLIEVNVAAETSKFGVSPEAAKPLAEHVAGLGDVELRGLMAMTPYDISVDESRRYFARTREVAEALARDLPDGAMSELSMGMTQDYESAVEEGATMVRVGTAIFGKRRDG